MGGTILSAWYHRNVNSETFHLPLSRDSQPRIGPFVGLIEVRLARVAIPTAGLVIGEARLALVAHELVPRGLDLLLHDLSVGDMRAGIPCLKRRRLISQCDDMRGEEVSQRSAGSVDGPGQG